MRCICQSGKLSQLRHAQLIADINGQRSSRHFSGFMWPFDRWRPCNIIKLGRIAGIKYTGDVYGITNIQHYFSCYFAVYLPIISALITLQSASSCSLSALRTAREKHAVTASTCSASNATYSSSSARTPPRVLRPPRDHIASQNRSLEYYLILM